MKRVKSKFVEKTKMRRVQQEIDRRENIALAVKSVGSDDKPKLISEQI